MPIGTFLLLSKVFGIQIRFFINYIKEKNFSCKLFICRNYAKFNINIYRFYAKKRENDITILCKSYLQKTKKDIE